MNPRLLNVLILFSVFLVPLLRATPDFGYEQIKVLFFIISMSLIILLWGGRGFKWSGVSIAGGIFILILLLTSLTGINPKISFLGDHPYAQGWVVMLYLWIFSLSVLQAKIKFSSWAFCLTGSAFLVSLLAIQDWITINLLGVPVVSYAGRVVVSFGQPNFYAGFLLLTLPFCYWLFKHLAGKQKYLAFAGGLVIVTGILVSYSRSAVLMALFLLILALVDNLRNKFKIGLVTFGLLGIIFFIVLKLPFGIVGDEVIRPVVTFNPDLTRESVEKRAYIWPLAFTVALQKPLTGYGLENIGWVFSNYFEENKHSLFEENLKISPVLLSLKELNIDRSHNYILDLLLFSGLPGFLAWVVLIIMLIARSRGILLVSLLTYLVWIQFQNQSIVHLVYFWLLVGLIDRT